MSLPVAVDAMGGDHAPDAIVAGAVEAAHDHGIDVVLVGPPSLDTQGLPLIEASEVIAMDDDPATAVRRKKDATLLRAAEAVRDGRACAIVSAGNTGATMASALFRMGRMKGIKRPAIATPIPVPGSTPTLLVDAGANADCQPEWLLQFARMGAVFFRTRYGVAEPRVALLSIGEEDTKGNALVQAARALISEASAAGALGGGRFTGNVEGRDLLTDAADVVVCDGYTGNVALKTLEGAMKFLIGRVMDAFGTNDDTRAAAEVMLPALAPLAVELHPDTTGGAALLGVEGLCIISHGSSTSTAIVNAVRVGADLAASPVLRDLRNAVS